MMASEAGSESQETGGLSGPSRRVRSAVTCTNCLWAQARANGLCHACDTYRKRTGRARPERLIVAHGKRVLAGMVG
jgi:hypothetical protein